jgi:hypothetical protein
MPTIHRLVALLVGPPDEDSVQAYVSVRSRARCFWRRPGRLARRSGGSEDLTSAQPEPHRHYSSEGGETVSRIHLVSVEEEKEAHRPYREPHETDKGDAVSSLHA